MLASRRTLGCLVIVMLLALTAPWTNAVALAAAAECELVELYPGYPGYQGFVTGVDGVGDHACLEDLESEDATFSKFSEDRLNREAAEELGISGSMDVWTWENWLSIEAERGLTPTCYSCAFVAAEARPEPRDVPRDSNDPRLLAGQFGGTEIHQRYLEERDMYSPYRNLWEDYQLRAWAGLAFPSNHPNAEQLLDYYEEMLDQAHNASADQEDGSVFWSVREECDALIEQGGYFPVPTAAYPEDQLFVFITGLYSFGLILPDESLTALTYFFEDHALEWQSQSSSGSISMSFGEYLRSVGAAASC